jgi:hypothetical protein
MPGPYSSPSQWKVPEWVPIVCPHQLFCPLVRARQLTLVDFILFAIGSEDMYAIAENEGIRRLLEARRGTAERLSKRGSIDSWTMLYGQVER